MSWIITIPCPACRENNDEHTHATLMEEGEQLVFKTKKSALKYIDQLPLEWKKHFQSPLNIRRI
jgi:hypothetical protein